MIYELTTRNAKKSPIVHWPNVPWLKTVKSIEFKPGINVVFGPNATGKSTLLSALAVLTHCKEENWPRVTKSSLAMFLRPTCVADGLVLQHDGMPCRYLGIDDPGFAPEKGVKEVQVALSSTTMAKALDKQSAGQATLTKLVRFLRAEPQKVRYSVTEAKLPSSWKETWRAGTESLKNTTARPDQPKQQVLLLDEVDRSLDFAKQAAVWKQLRALAADGHHQIIIASHSPFAVNVPGAHYIETQPDYLATTRKALSLLLKEAA